MLLELDGQDGRHGEAGRIIKGSTTHFKSKLGSVVPTDGRRWSIQAVPAFLPARGQRDGAARDRLALGVQGRDPSGLMGGLDEAGLGRETPWVGPRSPRSPETSFMNGRITQRIERENKEREREMSATSPPPSLPSFLFFRKSPAGKARQKSPLQISLSLFLSFSLHLPESSSLSLSCRPNLSLLSNSPLRLHFSGCQGGMSGRFGIGTEGNSSLSLSLSFFLSSDDDDTQQSGGAKGTGEM